MSGLSTERINQMPGGYFCFAEGGQLLTINQTLLDELGYEASDVIGRSVESLLTIASRIFYQTHFYPLLKLQGKANEIFLSLRMKNGDSLPVLLNASASRQDELLVHQCVCLVVRQRQKYEEEILQAKHVAEQALRENSELTHAKQALEVHQQLLDHQLVELEQKNQELVQFGKLITHDLQEPLRKIMLLTDVLRQEVRQSLVLDDDKLLRRIMEASQNMRELIRRLREYLLLDTVAHLSSPVNLHQLALNAKELVGQQRDTRDIRLTIQEMPPIEGNWKQLTELFVQLIDNSVRFAHQPVPTPIEITISGHLIDYNSFRSMPGKYRYQEFVQITYSDNGPGIQAERSDRIFQIQKKHTDGMLGLGFGLAICKKIVVNHGGMISVNATSKPGAQFIILLPVRHDNPHVKNVQ